MKKFIVVCFLQIVTVISAVASEYDVSNFYEIVEPKSGTKVVCQYDEVKEAKYILVPNKIDTGKYVVKLSKIGSNMYKIQGTDLCIETRYCHEYASYEEVILIVESNYGYNKGKVIFD